MTLGTIIAIVLGIAVLVLLIWGFSTGWNNMWDKVTKYGAGSENVGAIIQSCALKCSSGDTYNFCIANQTLNTGEIEVVKPCNSLNEYGVESCGKFSCSL